MTVYRFHADCDDGGVLVYAYGSHEEAEKAAAGHTYNGAPSEVEESKPAGPIEMGHLAAGHWGIWGSIA